VIFILPETKGISLEWMEKIFGEVDFVEAGERETTAEKIEAIALAQLMRMAISMAMIIGRLRGRRRFMRMRLGRERTCNLRGRNWSRLEWLCGMLRTSEWYRS
jgi:hypothetical protein